MFPFVPEYPLRGMTDISTLPVRPSISSDRSPNASAKICYVVTHKKGLDGNVELGCYGDQQPTWERSTPIGRLENIQSTIINPATIPSLVQLVMTLSKPAMMSVQVVLLPERRFKVGADILHSSVP